MSFSVRNGRANDLDAVFQLNQHVFPESWSYESLKNAICGYCELVVIEQHTCLIGYLLIQDILDEVHILQIAIAPSWRRRGLAKRLTQYMLTQKPTCTKMVLEVRASNVVAQTLYNKLGFTEDGQRKNYYHADATGKRENAVTMSKVLKS